MVRAVVVHALGDRPQAVRAVVDRVHARHHGQQDLRGADVAGRLLPADVLLPGLQREPVRGGAVGVPGHPDQPARQRPLESRPYRQVAGVRAAEPERHPEPLGGAGGDVGADLPRRPQQRQREQVGGDGDQRAFRVGGLDQRRRGRGPRRTRPGTAGAAPKNSSGNARRPGRTARARCRAARPGCAAPTASAGGCRRPPRTRGSWLFDDRRASVIASATAVPSSSIDAFAVVSPVRSVTMVWKFSSASSRPWLISGWYGV